MIHFRERKPGNFHLDQEVLRRGRDYVPWETGTLPLLRFAAKHGAACDLWSGERLNTDLLLNAARLRWPVERHNIALSASLTFPSQEIPHYRALVRPDSGEVMSVVTTAYEPANNEWVASAALSLGQRFDSSAALIAATGFGRTNERTLFVVRISLSSTRALVLLACNTHGGEGAIRFRIVEVDKHFLTILAPASRHASLSVPHTGKVHDNLERKGQRETVKEYVTETAPLWDRLHETLWTPRHTKALIKELWDERPDDTSRIHPSHPDAGHPGSHLVRALADHHDAATAYRRICAYLGP